jgi:hypothetical protein
MREGKALIGPLILVAAVSAWWCSCFRRTEEGLVRLILFIVSAVNYYTRTSGAVSCCVFVANKRELRPALTANKFQATRD